MRILLLFVASAALLPYPASAQTPAANPIGWARVQALPPGTTVSLKTLHDDHSCKIAAVTTDTIACVGRPAPIPLAEVRRVTIHRRALSALVGSVVGGGIGAVSGAAAASPNAIGGRGLVALVIGVPAAVLGAIIGVLTDFTHSTLYRVP